MSDWLGLDIGGANLKAAHTDGRARTVPFELWKRPEDLPRMLASLVRSLGRADAFAITMTAELCDCFATKAQGVHAVLDAVAEVAGGRRAVIWCVDGSFADPDQVRETPRVAAASNWLALATLAARSAPEGPAILIDIGSTTSDLIPLRDGLTAARGRTDTERLQTGELIYAGAIRTPLAALATDLPHRDVMTGLASELFATTLDVYLTLGDLSEDPVNTATADGRPWTIAAAQTRLARVVAADRDEFTADDAKSLARAADAVLIDRLLDAAKRACAGVIPRPRAAVISGAGEFLARRLAERVVAREGTILSLNEAWGAVASAAGCAFAVASLARERFDS